MSAANLIAHEEVGHATPRVGESDAVRRALGLDRRSRWRRRIGWGVALLLLAGVAIFAVLKLTAPTPPVRWLTAPVTRGELATTVTATGSLAPLRKVDVAAEVSGRIVRVTADENDRVTRDQVLIEIDTERLRSQLAQAKAQAALARATKHEAGATLTEARGELTRAQALAPGGITSARELAAARAAYARAQARVESSEAQEALADAQVASVETDIAKAVIVSPIDGVVLTRQVEPGNAVAATFQAPVLMTLAQDLAAMELELDVDEADVGAVTAGQHATFTVDAFPERTFEATVLAVRFAPKTVSNVVTYPARLAVDNRESLLRPGMTTTATITTAVAHDVLTVPNAALRFTPPVTGPARTMFAGPPPGAGAGLTPEQLAKLNAPKVYVLENGQPVPVEVVLGATNGERTAIREGPARAEGPEAGLPASLKEGTPVVLGQDRSGTPGATGGGPP